MEKSRRAIQIQSDIVSLMLIVQAAGLKEYKAEWLKNAQSVMRDATGKFAKKAGITIPTNSQGKTEGTEPIAVENLAPSGIEPAQLNTALKKRQPDPKKAQKYLKELEGYKKEAKESFEINQALNRKVQGLDKPEFSDLNKIVRLEIINGGNRALIRSRKTREALANYEEAIGTPGGFDLDKRVKELDEIIQKEGADSLSAQWRAGVIQAELKYGDKLDALASGDKKDYDALMSALQKKDAPTGSFSKLSESDNTYVTEYEVKGIGNQSPLYSPKDREKTISIALKEAENLQSMLKVPMDVGYGVTASRSDAFPGLKNPSPIHTVFEGRYDLFLRQFKYTDVIQKKDGYVNLGDLQGVGGLKGENPTGYSNNSTYEDHVRELTFHETGHLFEVKMGLVDMSVQFRNDRGKETPQELKQLDPIQRNVVADKFLDPYVGTIYSLGMMGITDRPPDRDKECATEVISSGFEALGSAKFAKEAVRTDRELMLYAISVMERDAPAQKVDTKSVLQEAEKRRRERESEEKASR